MVNTTQNKTQDMIGKMQDLKSESKLKFCQTISKYYDKMNYRRQSNTFQFEENPFAKNADIIGKIVFEVSLILKLLQTKPQAKSKKINYYDLFYTVIKNVEDKDDEEKYGISDDLFQPFNSL